MVQSNLSRASSSSPPSIASSRDGDSPSTSGFSGPATSTAIKQPQTSSESDPESPSLENTALQHKHEQQQPHHFAVDIHSDGRFMSALRAIHASDQGEAVVPKRDTSVTSNGAAKTRLENTTETSSPEKNSPSPVKKPRRKLQRSRAFSIDRSPSPSGRVCEIEDGGEEAPASKRRTTITSNGAAKSRPTNTTERPSPEKKTPSPVKKPRRKLQRSRAFSIDRSPSPSGRICEINDGDKAGEDELCALFDNINR
ncbi:uncharacterized protein J3D65DRAFT_666246 [Phyllosticta citribraziliensis]|uniref:Uncharacterized protein n=1 Tax=Phyllosticta citribraziliensis TaxID=989973 RepID=A0ABR1LWI2_9PEZI